MPEIKKHLRRGYDVFVGGDCNEGAVLPYEPEFYALNRLGLKGHKLKLCAEEGSPVKCGSPLLYSKDNETLKLVSPAAGRIERVIRNERRQVETIVIRKEGDARLSFDTSSVGSPEELAGLLAQAGLFPFITRRPFSHIADSRELPRDVFINVCSSAPLRMRARTQIGNEGEAFQTGIQTLAKLCKGDVHLVCAPEDADYFARFKGALTHCFSGRHPSGNSGVHIHHISPVKGADDCVWTLDALGVLMIGRFMQTGSFDPALKLKLAGPMAKKAAVYQTAIGASLSGLIENDEALRVISGDVLSGVRLSNELLFPVYTESLISVIAEAQEPEFLAWLSPFSPKQSKHRFFLSAFLPSFKPAPPTTALHGGRRALIESSVYEDVLPMDILPQHLIKSAICGDLDSFERLGAYELAEEDLALCEYVCPSKTEFQQVFREAMDKLYKEYKRAQR